MYNIGYLSLSENSDKTYIDQLKMKFKEITLLKREEILQEKNFDLDVLIIRDDENQWVGNICEMIISFKQNSNVLLWVVSEELEQANRSIYIRLGADGILGNEGEPENLSNLISNMLTSVNKICEINSGAEMELNMEATKESPFKLVNSNLSVIVNGEDEISLTKLEFLTIEFLYTNLGKAVSYEDIYKNVWKTACGERRYRVSNMIFNLRKKIEQDEHRPQFIKTVRSKGYMLTI